jgi:hypothetical protein
MSESEEVERLRTSFTSSQAVATCEASETDQLGFVLGD